MNWSILILLLNWIFGFVMGIIVDRIIITKWLDGISKIKLQMVLQAIIGGLVTIAFIFVITWSAIHTDYKPAAELYWVFGIIVGSVFGLDPLKNKDMAYNLAKIKDRVLKSEDNA